jgi:hypothetical protein
MARKKPELRLKPLPPTPPLKDELIYFVISFARFCFVYCTLLLFVAAFWLFVIQDPPRSSHAIRSGVAICSIITGIYFGFMLFPLLLAMHFRRSFLSYWMGGFAGFLIVALMSPPIPSSLVDKLGEPLGVPLIAAFCLWYSERWSSTYVRLPGRP